MKQSYRSKEDYWQCDCPKQNWIMDIDKCNKCGKTRTQALTGEKLIKTDKTQTKAQELLEWLNKQAKKLEDWPELKIKAQFIVNSVMCNLFEIKDTRTGKIVAASSDTRINTFNVCSAPNTRDKKLEAKAVRGGVISVLKEKIVNDMHAANTVLQRAREEGIISEEANITWEDLIIELQTPSCAYLKRATEEIPETETVTFTAHSSEE